MTFLAAGTLAALLSGCLTSTAPEVSYWMVEYKGASAAKGGARHAVARLSSLQVRAPYDVRDIPVLRADGSMAFDPYNKFPVIPSQLLRGAAIDALAASGSFGSVVTASSAVSADVSAEVSVLKLALDCRNEGVRKAVASVAVRIVDRGRNTISVATGAGEADAASGEYSTAFSLAFSSAMAGALGAQ